jgi:hypothetical protein
MTYRDGIEVELGDTVEVDECPEELEPEEAIVLKLGKKTLFVEWSNPHLNPRKEWVYATDCDLVSRS